MDDRKQCTDLAAKCVDLEKKVWLLEKQLSDANREKELLQKKYIHVKQKNVKLMPNTENCKFCGQTYKIDKNGWQNHFMRVCPIVRNACQRLLNSHLSQQKHEKIAENNDNVLQSVARVSVQLSHLNSLPEPEVLPIKSNDKPVEQTNSFGYDFDNCYGFFNDSVPEVSVEIEIPMINGDEHSNSINTISIGY